ncbi:Uncharacterised protein [Mycobacterium tuberculosis]|uniref:Uncharacterized protein n=1 Tax=Mycobacterium tuberculosis TaxID=1773 RepID=A0A0T9Y0Z8_MYCTX|nr:Uncharacterised protein [Mycobacterium tuberculosis]CFE60810.1 Uncharacterised protein [Mycobacterium tuberculosis]CKT18652.1 Uncharacterised protein [Mycobacterium tuberculosis]CNN61598.1 Uncharacterised protein [Mycobacterium tuberculosis]CNV07657.1 Uncharacterised protein [Mycobacterium tuberculosis]
MDGELAVCGPKYRLLHPGRSTLAPTAHLVVGGGGAVLRCLATVADRGDATVGGPGEAPLQTGHGGRGSVRRVPDCQSRHDGFRHRRGRIYLGGHPRPDLLRHRYPCAGVADRLRGSGSAGAGLAIAEPRVVPDPDSLGTADCPSVAVRRAGWAGGDDSRRNGQCGRVPPWSADRGGRCGRHRGCLGSHGAARSGGPHPGLATVGVAGHHIVRRLSVALANLSGAQRPTYGLVGPGPVCR